MAPVAQSAVFADPSADGAKAQWTASTGTDWQAVNKGIRQPTVPSTTPNLFSSTDTNLQDIVFAAIPAIPAGHTIRFIRFWVYYEGAIPANHTVTLQASRPGGATFGSFWRNVAGESGWKAGPKLGPCDSSGVFVKAGDQLNLNLNLGEASAQASNTTTTAVYVEIGTSTMEHLKVSGRNMVGAYTGTRWTGSFAQYPSLVFDNWFTGGAGARSAIRNMRRRGLDMVRVFVPYGDMMTNSTTVNEAKWTDLEAWLEICVEEGLRVDLTGLVTFRSTEVDHVPAFLDALTEAQRWATFQLWWRRCAQACSGCPAVVVYDIVNEPLTKDTGAGSWYTDPAGGFTFGTYLCKSLSGRTEAQVATNFMNSMRDSAGANGIRVWDRNTPCSYGIFTNTAAWRDPGEVCLIHYYPHANAIKADAIDVHKSIYKPSGKPLFAEETQGQFPNSNEGMMGLWRYFAQEGYVAGGGSWPNALGSYETGVFRAVSRCGRVFQRRDVSGDRVGGVASMAGRLGQRFR